MTLAEQFSFIITGMQWFAISLMLFGALSYISPNRVGQPLIRRGFLSDVAYWFLGYVVYVKIFVWVAALLGYLFFTIAISLKNSDVGAGTLASLPVLLQIFLILFITDIIQYWIHRIFHKGPLWGYHAIHHSSREVDWLSAVRAHPVNYIFQFMLPGAIAYSLGFSALAYAILTPLNALYSSMVHANLSWTFGPLRYVLASPVFHRWHHTYPSEGGMRNFAPTFPVLDLLFGTYYMPPGRLPERFGTEDEISENILSQFIYPFRRKK